jgi:hypothetical protein
MKNTILTAGSALLLIAGAATAQAAQPANAGPVVQNSQAMKTADQGSTAPMTIRQQIQTQLTKDGYTNVTITPSSFYVHAKDKQGHPVAMVIGPDSFTEVTEVAPKTAANPNQAAPNAANQPATPKPPKT